MVSPDAFNHRRTDPASQISLLTLALKAQMWIAVREAPKNLAEFIDSKESRCKSRVEK
jgi:hypothetical protein